MHCTDRGESERRKMADIFEVDTEYLGLEEIDFDEDIPIVGSIFPVDDVESNVIVDEDELFEHGDQNIDENIDFEIPTIVTVDEEGLENLKEESYDSDSTPASKISKKYPKRNKKTKSINTTVHPPSSTTTLTTTSTKTFICRICSKMYQREYAFKRHQASCK